jgi:hypothetical protein
MAIKQVKDLLHWSAEFHAQLAEQYAQAAPSDERMKMTLSFLAEREQKQQCSLQDFISHASPTLLETWLRDSQEFNHTEVLACVRGCVNCHTPFEVLGLSITAHNFLKDMYHLREQLADIPEEAELFNKLATNEDAEIRNLTRDIAWLEMM